MDEVVDWLEKTAPDENKDIYMMDMYAYLIKVRCYIQTGKYMAAHVLVKQLITLLIPGKRHMDLCECYMLSAIVYHKAKDEKHSLEEMKKALGLAKKYKYIRLLADEGTDDFTEQVMQLAAEVGGHFPDYLKSPEDYYEHLTNMEQKVLCLMAQGLSNDEIADRLGKKTGTVKFHSNNIFRKLEVQNRHQAVSRGREVGLI